MVSKSNFNFKKAFILHVGAFVLIFSLVGFKTQFSPIILYKNNDKFTHTFEVIESTFWDTREMGGLDILEVSDLNEKRKFYDIIENSITKTYIDKPFLHPEYAVVLRYNLKNDTLYIDENLRHAYLVENDLMFEVEDELLYKYFEEKSFLTRLSTYENKN